MRLLETLTVRFKEIIGRRLRIISSHPVLSGDRAVSRVSVDKTEDVISPASFFDGSGFSLWCDPTHPAFKAGFFMVGATGIEPVTPAV